MQTPLAYLQSIQPRHAITLAAALAAAWALDGLLSLEVKSVIDALLFGVWSLPELLHRGKAGKWPGVNHPAGYIPLLGWLAAACVWFLPLMRADYLPPSSLIDAALIAVAGMVLLRILKGMAKASA